MARPVRIARLALTDFRNYARLDVAFAPRHVVLTGDNGAGKTNLLEALSLLSPGRGLRRAAHAETVRAMTGAGGVAGFSIFAEVDGMAGPAEIGTGTLGGEAGQRRLRIDGANARTLDTLLDHLRIAWLTPAMDGLFTGPAGDRRRFLDRLVLAIDPLHARRSIDYERAMRSRNRLLSEGRFDPAWLDGIELQMAELGIAMAFARQDYVALLGDLIARGAGDDAAFPAVDVALEGFNDDASHMAAVDLEARYLAALRDGRRRDASAGRTLDGPHRADLSVRHRQKSMPAALCSTGEQKALLVGLLLAHARLVADMTGHAPLLLLDEIAAHLDAGRRAALFTMIDALGGQAFMTGTDAAMFAALGDHAQFFRVDSGTLTEFRP